MNQIVVGPFFPEPDRTPLSDEERRAIRGFHELHYARGFGRLYLSWFGYGLIKTAVDMWMYQELIVRRKPDVVVETGTYNGGSALYFAMLQDRLEHGRVITIDIEDKPERPKHPRITYVTGSSVDADIVAQVHAAVGTSRAMVILDSDHSAAHVYEEILAYNPLVQVDDYLIVEDTDINGHPVCANHGPGPMEGLVRFLAETEAFQVDKDCERLLMTVNPSGYLRRVA